MNYSEGMWHAIIGLEPQHNNMRGCPAYDAYMLGYNKTKESIKKTKEEINGQDKSRIRRP